MKSTTFLGHFKERKLLRSQLFKVPLMLCWCFRHPLVLPELRQFDVSQCKSSRTRSPSVFQTQVFQTQLAVSNSTQRSELYSRVFKPFRTQLTFFKLSSTFQPHLMLFKLNSTFWIQLAIQTTKLYSRISKWSTGWRNSDVERVVRK